MGIIVRAEEGRVILDVGRAGLRGFMLSASQAMRAAEVLDEAATAAGPAPEGALIPGTAWQIALERQGWHIAMKFLPPKLGAGAYCVIRPSTARTVARLLRVHAKRAHEAMGLGREVGMVLH